MRKTGGKCIRGGKEISAARLEGLCKVTFRTLEVSQNFGKSGIAGRQSFRDFTAQGIGAARRRPVSLFGEEIAKPQTILRLREPDSGFGRVRGSQVPVNIRRYPGVVKGIPEVAVILQETCHVVVGASQQRSVFLAARIALDQIAGGLNGAPQNPVALFPIAAPFQGSAQPHTDSEQVGDGFCIGRIGPHPAIGYGIGPSHFG
jgi:hypothetical protein